MGQRVSSTQVFLTTSFVPHARHNNSSAGRVFIENKHYPCIFEVRWKMIPGHKINFEKSDNYIGMLSAWLFKSEFWIIFKFQVVIAPFIFQKYSETVFFYYIKKNRLMISDSVIAHITKDEEQVRSAFV